MTPEYIRVLIDYNYWARDRILASADQLSQEDLTRPVASSFGSVTGSSESIWRRAMVRRSYGPARREHRARRLEGRGVARRAHVTPSMMSGSSRRKRRGSD